MPFFIPVVYDDDRIQLNDNVSLLRGDHSFKAGFEYNDVTSSQTFIGFANGRYIFDSFDGFMNYVNLGPDIGELLGRRDDRPPAAARPGSSIAGPAAPLPPAGRRRRPLGGGGRHPGPRAEGERDLHPGPVAAEREPDHRGGSALGADGPAERHHAGERGLLRAVHRSDRRLADRAGEVPVQRRHPRRRRPAAAVRHVAARPRARRTRCSASTSACSLPASRR